MRLLLTGAGGPAARALGDQLTARGHWVGGVDMRDIGSPILGAFQRVCTATDHAYLDEVCALARCWAVDAVIPSVSEELAVFAEQQDRIPVPVLVAGSDAVHVADDKLRTAERLQDVGVAVPLFSLPSMLGSAARAVAEMDGPVIVKPRVSRGGRGVRLIRGGEVADAAVEAYWGSLDDSFVVQAFAPGTEYAPVVYRDDAGRCTVCVVLRKTALKEGVVGNALTVERSNASRDDDVAQVACAAADALDLTGPVDIDIRRRADGVPVVLEVNARFGANSAHAPELLDAALHALDLRSAALGNALMG